MTLKIFCIILAFGYGLVSALVYTWIIAPQKRSRRQFLRSQCGFTLIGVILSVVFYFLFR